MRLLSFHPLRTLPAEITVDFGCVSPQARVPWVVSSDTTSPKELVCLIPVTLQNIPVSAPSVPFLSLCVLDAGKPSVELFLPFNSLGIVYFAEKYKLVTGTKTPGGGRTFVVITIDDFIPQSSVALGILGLQGKMIHDGSEQT